MTPKAARLFAPEAEHLEFHRQNGSFAFVAWCEERKKNNNKKNTLGIFLACEACACSRGRVRGVRSLHVLEGVRVDKSRKGEYSNALSSSLAVSFVSSSSPVRTRSARRVDRALRTGYTEHSSLQLDKAFSPSASKTELGSQCGRLRIIR